MDEMVKIWGRKRFYISCTYFCTIFFMVKILLVTLRDLYIQYTRTSVMKKRENVTVEKMVIFAKTFDHYHHKINFDDFFRL